MWFVDASHFLYSGVLGCLWCLVRQWLPSPAGRRRWNVLGAVNAVTRELRWVSTPGKFTGDWVVLRLKKLAHSREGPPVAGPRVTVVLDNARYQKTWLVRLAAAWYDMELLYLPTYSPNLNLIERLWKFVKKEALASRCLATADDFHQAIERCLAEVGTTHQDEMRSLLTLNFQLFDNVPVVPG